MKSPGPLDLIAIELFLRSKFIKQGLKRRDFTTFESEATPNESTNVDINIAIDSLMTHILDGLGATFRVVDFTKNTNAIQSFTDTEQLARNVVAAVESPSAQIDIEEKAMMRTVIWPLVTTDYDDFHNRCNKNGRSLYNSIDNFPIEELDIQAMVQKINHSLACLKVLGLEYLSTITTDEADSMLLRAKFKVFEFAMRFICEKVNIYIAKIDDKSITVHNGIDYSAPASILLEAFPDSRKIADGRYWLCSHWAVLGYYYVGEENVKCLLSKTPEGLSTCHSLGSTSSEGFTPVHLLCMTPDIRFLRILAGISVEAFSVSARRDERTTAEDKRYTQGCYPLHIVCRFLPVVSEMASFLNTISPSHASLRAGKWENCFPLDTFLSNCTSGRPIVAEIDLEISTLLPEDPSVDLIGCAICTLLRRLDRLPFRPEHPRHGGDFGYLCEKLFCDLVSKYVSHVNSYREHGRSLLDIAAEYKLSDIEFMTWSGVQPIQLLLMHCGDSLMSQGPPFALQTALSERNSKVFVTLLEYCVNGPQFRCQLYTHNGNNILHERLMMGYSISYEDAADDSDEQEEDAADENDVQAEDAADDSDEQEEGANDEEISFVSAILGRYPELALQENDEGFNPLQKVLSEVDINCSWQAVEMVLRTNPSLAHIPYTCPHHLRQNLRLVGLDGQLLLHMIVRMPDPDKHYWRCVRCLLDEFPQGASHQDRFGNFPFNYVAIGHYELGRMILNAYPDVDRDLYRYLNWRARRWAMYVALGSKQSNMFSKLMNANDNLFRRVILFL